MFKKTLALAAMLALTVSAHAWTVKATLEQDRQDSGSTKLITDAVTSVGFNKFGFDVDFGVINNLTEGTKSTAKITGAEVGLAKTWKLGDVALTGRGEYRQFGHATKLGILEATARLPLVAGFNADVGFRHTGSIANGYKANRVYVGAQRVFGPVEVTAGVARTSIENRAFNGFGGSVSYSF